MTPPDSLFYEVLDKYVLALNNAPAYPMLDFHLNPASAIYTELSDKQILYRMEDAKSNPIYVGITRDGTREKQGADRLCGQARGSDALWKLSEVREVVLPSNYFQRDHFVRFIVIADPFIRRVAEWYAIKVIKPEAQPKPPQLWT